MTSSCVYCILHAAVVVYLHVAVTNGLECFCDICTENDNKCVTDGYCFASTSMDKHTGDTKYQYRCLNKGNFFPPEFPIQCIRRPTETHALKCCNTSDMCNKDVVPSLAPLPTGKVAPLHSPTSMMGQPLVPQLAA